MKGRGETDNAGKNGAEPRKVEKVVVGMEEESNCMCMYWGMRGGVVQCTVQVEMVVGVVVNVRHTSA